MCATDTSHQNQEEDDACGSKVPVRSTQVCEKINPRGAVQKAEIRIKNGGGVHNEDTAKKYIQNETPPNSSEQFRGGSRVHLFATEKNQNGTHGGAEVRPIWGPMGP